MRSLIGGAAAMCALLCGGEARAEDPWGKFKLGAGLSFTLDVGKLDRISEAVIVDGVVRVTDQNNGRARIMLEGHHFFADSKDKTGWGPFVAVQPGSNEIIDAIGMGLMVGFRPDKDSKQSFNIGVGVVFDPTRACWAMAFARTSRRQAAKPKSAIARRCRRES